LSIERKQVLVADYTRDKVRTQQHFKRECDINQILQRMHKNGGLVSPSDLTMRQAFYADVSSIGDFAEMTRQVDDARVAFMTMPSKVRARFNNDPAELLQFVRDPNNRDEAIELGMIDKTASAEAPQTASPTTAEQPEPPQEDKTPSA